MDLIGNPNHAMKCSTAYLPTAEGPIYLLCRKGEQGHKKQENRQARQTFVTPMWVKMTNSASHSTLENAHE
jgi:hypothetical protein